LNNNIQEFQQISTTIKGYNSLVMFWPKLPCSDLMGANSSSSVSVLERDSLFPSCRQYWKNFLFFVFDAMAKLVRGPGSYLAYFDIFGRGTRPTRVLSAHVP
jgi:hypothetical protein